MKSPINARADRVQMMTWRVCNASQGSRKPRRRSEAPCSRSPLLKHNFESIQHELILEIDVKLLVHSVALGYVFLMFFLASFVCLLMWR